MSNFRTLTEIDRQVLDKLFELSINRYSEVRRQAQTYLFTLFSRFFFSYQLIIDRVVELLTKTDPVQHYEVKGCLYILLGNDSVFIPTKHSWSMLEKLWPAIACTQQATKISTQNLINCVMEKICKRFNTVAITEETSESSRQAAANLWRPLNEEETIASERLHEERKQNNIRSYSHLMENLTKMIYNEPLTCRQQIITVTFILFLFQKQVQISLPCTRILVDLLIHDNIDIRRVSRRRASIRSRFLYFRSPSDVPRLCYGSKNHRSLIYKSHCTRFSFT